MTRFLCHCASDRITCMNIHSESNDGKIKLCALRIHISNYKTFISQFHHNSCRKETFIKLLRNLGEASVGPRGDQTGLFQNVKEIRSGISTLVKHHLNPPTTGFTSGRR